MATGVIPHIDDLHRHIEASAKRGVAAHLLAGMTVDEVTGVERRMNALLPLALRDLFRATAGIDVAGFGVVDFRGTLPFQLEGFEHALPLVADDVGNMWVLDADDAGCLTVLFVSHAPPVVVIQAEGLSAFMVQIFEPRGPERLIAPLVETIWRKDPFAASRIELLSNRDAVVQRFSHDLRMGDFLYDLRGRRPGMGFTWNPAAPVPIRRAGAALIFASRSPHVLATRCRQLLMRLWSRLAAPVRRA
ncbi:MAG TPA: hypothetical protein VJ276_16695 [Thermoanaerobaculia bacterium]|nr:hypothetical protein [Thermoanaerobaculia bacterium]